MAALLRKMYEAYQFINSDLADPRTADLPLMNRMASIIALLVFYNYFVLKLGPRLMENRKPFKLKRLILIYNAVQVVLNACLFWNGWQAWGAIKHYTVICSPMEWDDTPFHRQIGRLVYCYFLLKLFDIMDTVFFVLRKKQTHISFLHVYHHTGMVALSFGATKWLPGGHGTMVGLVNCFVHVVMYTYYFTTSLYPKYKRNLWWKKHITQLQMAQFLFLTVHSAILLLQPDCAYPKFTVMVIVPQNFFMFLLFLDFYRKTYRTEEKQN